MPGSPSWNIKEVKDKDDIDMKIAAENSQWMTATANVKEHITPDSQYKLKNSLMMRS